MKMKPVPNRIKRNKTFIMHTVSSLPKPIVPLKLITKIYKRDGFVQFVPIEISEFK